MVKMLSNIERVKAKMLKKVKPSEVERIRVLSLADKLVDKTEAAARKEGVETTVRVEGSVAKDTWLREEPDIDIFMKLPTSIPRKDLGSTCLKIAKEATKGSKQVERFAEHPYLEAFVDSTRVNIVPCYKVKPGEWLSATDRTPYHTDFVKSKLNENLRDEIRLLKRFMKGLGVYGAEIKTGGFSGYLCELLILHYSTFVKVLEAAADWKNPWAIDYAGHYDGRENEIPKLFEEPLVVIDPVDKGRNVAAAVRQERIIEFVAASRRFLQDPAEFFFYPSPTKAFSERQLVNRMRSQGTSFVFVEFGPVKTVPDVLWGQLYRTQRSLYNVIEKSDFQVVNSAVWSDEENLNVLFFEIENRLLPQSKKHLGPPVERRRESEDFLQKHLKSPTTLSGPRLEKGRWIVDVKRKYVDVVGLLRDNLRNGGRHVGVPELIAKTMAESFKICVDEEIIETYFSAPGFAVFLTDYLIGKPRWLRRTPLSRISSH